MEHMVASWYFGDHIFVSERVYANNTVILIKIIFMHLQQSRIKDIIQVFQELIDDQLFFQLQFDQVLPYLLSLVLRQLISLIS